RDRALLVQLHPVQGVAGGRAAESLQTVGRREHERSLAAGWLEDDIRRVTDRPPGDVVTQLRRSEECPAGLAQLGDRRLWPKGAHDRTLMSLVGESRDPPPMIRNGSVLPSPSAPALPWDPRGREDHD